MDRLDAWSLHHGYAIDRAKSTVAEVLFVTGGVAAFVGYLYFGSRYGFDFSWDD